MYCFVCKTKKWLSSPAEWGARLGSWELIGILNRLFVQLLENSSAFCYAVSFTQFPADLSQAIAANVKCEW